VPDEPRLSGAPRTLAEKLNHLARPPGSTRALYLDEIVEGIEATGGQVSRATLNTMMRGRNTNPRRSTIEALATYFKVSVSLPARRPPSRPHRQRTRAARQAA
jgi:transcriptional regulator with XRE-family HTH domain